MFHSNLLIRCCFVFQATLGKTFIDWMSSFILFVLLELVNPLSLFIILCFVSVLHLDSFDTLINHNFFFVFQVTLGKIWSPASTGCRLLFVLLDLVNPLSLFIVPCFVLRLHLDSFDTLVNHNFFVFQVTLGKTWFPASTGCRLSSSRFVEPPLTSRSRPWPTSPRKTFITYRFGNLFCVWTNELTVGNTRSLERWSQDFMLLL
jgi:hypothetical protein